jgi:hypothetical protein
LNDFAFNTCLADRIQRLLGPGGTDIAVRLSAFILFCLGVQILWSGGSELLKSVASTAVSPKIIFAAGGTGSSGRIEELVEPDQAKPGW